jgi:Uma2 family endonuclease
MKPVPAHSPPTTLTANEMLLDPAYRKGWELWDNTPVVRDASGGMAEVCGTALLAPLARYVQARDLGWVTGSNQGFFVARNPDRVLAADVAFTSHRRLERVPTRGYFPCAPDFAAEIRSPTDPWGHTVARIAMWLTHGAQVAWAIDPVDRVVAVMRPGQAARIVKPGATLDLAPVLPRFRVRVAALFLRAE